MGTCRVQEFVALYRDRWIDFPISKKMTGCKNGSSCLSIVVIIVCLVVCALACYVIRRYILNKKKKKPDVSGKTVELEAKVDEAKPDEAIRITS
ncbi:hypothetical protein LXL04_017923 [Taraxacum kok-saghyz]